MVVWVEFSNLLVILTCFEPVNIMENFVALSIVSEFDQMFFASMGAQSLKKLFYEEIRGKILVVQHTTSKRCKDNEKSSVIDDSKGGGRYRPMRVKMEDRPCCNRCTFVWYKAVKCFYVCVYVYFFPILILEVSLYFPILFGSTYRFD